MITLEDYIKDRTSLSFSGDYVECLSEDFDIRERDMWDLLDGIEDEVAKRISDSIYCQQTISKWIFKEVEDIITEKLQKKAI